MTKKVLSIAGFDSSGGAGIQADLKTFSAWGCYGMTVLTALPVQNTMGVKNCYDIPLQAIQDQLEAIFSDVIPDAIKIGMLFKSSIIECVAEFLKTRAAHIPIVLDPVMRAKSGDALLLPEAIENLKSSLIPQVTLITPNLPEASYLIEEEVTEREHMPRVAEKILKFGSQAVLLKGGHLDGEVMADFYEDQNGEQVWFQTKKVNTKNTHGTGCTLSAAIASGLALGLNLKEACELAKQYVQKALIGASELNVGLGAGPVHHFYHLWPTLKRI